MVGHSGRKNKGPLLQRPELSQVLFFKPEVEQNIALHVSPTARNSVNLAFADPVHLTPFILKIFLQH